MENKKTETAGTKVYPVFITFVDGQEFTFPAQSKDEQGKISFAMLECSFVSSVAVPSEKTCGGCQK